MSILLFIIILSALVLVHELGHFIAAKRAGVRVDEFGIGFPPRLFGKKFGETTYSVNALLIGGFVKIFGEDPNAESLSEEYAAQSFVRKSSLTQAWIIGAGVTFNILLAWGLLSAGFATGVPYSVDDSKYGSRVIGAELVIANIIPLSPAKEAGLKMGDKIRSLSAAGDTLENPSIVSTQKFITTHNEVTVMYARGEEVKTVLVRPRDGLTEGHPAIGIAMEMTGTLTLSIPEAIYEGARSTALFTWMTTVGLLDFLRNIFIGQANFSEVSGPVGIVGIVGSSAVLGFSHILILIALISINLAVINLLPFPALDGGRLLFILIETIKGSPIKPIIANTANIIGFVLLVLLMVVVTYHDIAKIVHG